MINTTNKIKRKIGRTQMRLSDLYRYMVTGLVADISGIDDYHATLNCINIKFTNNPDVVVYHAATEQERKEVIKQINKIL